jgi:AraC-like DNA-binding protein
MAHPLAFADFLETIGAPAKRHLRAGGLPAYDTRPDQFVKLSSAWAAFYSAARAEDEDLGWYVGQYVGDKRLSQTILENTEHAPSLYRGLQEFVRLVSSEASDLGLGIEERKDDIVLNAHYPTLKAAIGYAPSQAYQLPVYLSVIRHYLGEHWCPEEIGIEAKSLPRGAEVCFPNTLIRTSQERGYIVVPRKLLSIPAQNAVDLRQATDLLLTADLSFADRLRLLLRPYVTEGIPTKRFAAALMDTSQRTLSRRLRESGLSFRELLDELNFDIARELLGTSLSIREIARRVGYDDQAHFTRMFRRIGGICPSEFRKHLATCDTRGSRRADPASQSL